jgi:hypothetical protein
MSNFKYNTFGAVPRPTVAAASSPALKSAGDFDRRLKIAEFKDIRFVVFELTSQKKSFKWPFVRAHA